MKQRSADIAALTKQQADIARATFRVLADLLDEDHDLQDQILARAGCLGSEEGLRDLQKVRELLLRRMGGVQ